jgi:hypothetical protein
MRSITAHRTKARNDFLTTMMMMMMMMLLLLQDDDCDYENLSNKLLRFHSRSAPKLRAKTSPSSYQIVEIGERERETSRASSFKRARKLARKK